MSMQSTRVHRARIFGILRDVVHAGNLAIHLGTVREADYDCPQRQAEADASMVLCAAIPALHYSTARHRRCRLIFRQNIRREADIRENPSGRIVRADKRP